jgi:Fic family protein
MSTETATPTASSAQPASQLPIALIACTLAILLVAQIGASMESAGLLKWQRENLEKQIANLQTADKQAAEAIKNREPVVKQSGELQNQLQTLLNDLLDLAKDDKDAQEIINKWQIKRAPAPAAADTAAKPADDKK